MEIVKDYEYDHFKFAFNEKSRDILEPRAEKLITFNIISGDHIKIYISSNSEEEMRSLALDKVPHMLATKEMIICEPYPLYDSDFLKNNICKIFGEDKSNIVLKDIKLIKREKDISTYSITADVYSEIYSVLKRPFSLESLYYVFVGSDEKGKKTIVDYLNSLKFTCTNNINYYKAKKLAREEELKLLNLNETYEERLEDTLIEATRNANIIKLFNIDNPLLEIPTPVGNAYTDDLISFNKLAEENKGRQLQKELDNFSLWLGDIDD